MVGLHCKGVGTSSYAALGKGGNLPGRLTGLPADFCNNDASAGAGGCLRDICQRVEHTIV